MFKKELTNKFDLASSSYGRVDFVQADAAKLLSDNIPDINPESILELGAGTGNLTSELLHLFPECRYFVNDISKQTLQLHKQKFGCKVDYIYGDFDDCKFDSYDLIASNFAFQWSSNLEVLIKKCLETSKCLAFTTLLQGTFQNWYEILGIEQNYPDPEQLKKFVDTIPNSKFSEKVYEIKFSSKLEFMRYLKMLGANSCTKKIPISKLRFITKDPTEFTTQYNVAFVIIQR